MSDKVDKKKLNSGAKAFVPSGLKASASAWTPTPNSKDAKVDKAAKTAASVVAAPAPAKKEKAPPSPAPAPAPSPPKPPVSVVSVWGKKSSDAIRSVPTDEQKANIETTNYRERDYRDRDRGQGRRQNENRDRDDSKGGWRNNKKQPDPNWSRGKKQTAKKEDDGWQRGKQVPLDLIKPGEGDTDADKAVKRVNVGELLTLRLSYVAPPLIWESEGALVPPDECRWISDTRVQEIDAMANKQRLGGDVSSHRKKKKDNDTAPKLEDCKPLEVNEDTRWKANVFKKGEDGSSEESDKDVLRQALLVLNKLSLTKFEKLSDAFIDTGIGRNAECLAGAIELIVKKAQDEPHFAAMYAALCLKLAHTPMDFEEPGKKKKFKKMLLSECQKEFETETSTKIAEAIKDIEEEEERELKAVIIKKHYLGHMRFIGELYKGDLINIKIMLMVLPQLLEGSETNEVDEEKVECFAKLMTVIGLILEQQSVGLRNAGKPDNFEKLMKCWEIVEKLAGKSTGGVTISNRIKFMLQDLLEMKENGWTTRREEESAKTIAQIHKDAAKEARRGSKGMSRSTSNNSLRRMAKPTTDKDGFTEVVGPAGGGFGRSQSLGNFHRSGSRNSLKQSKSKQPKASGSFAALSQAEKSPKKAEAKPEVKKAKVEYLSPKDCGDKAKNYLKEYFVSGDADDAVLSIHELIGAGEEGSVARSAKVVESSILLVLEMKVEDVKKCLEIICRCYTEQKIDKAAFPTCLDDPLEFLSDIAIDAPLATAHMATIIAALIKVEAISFDYLLTAPEYFRTDSNAAAFGGKVLKALGGDAATDAANVDVVEKLMTDDDKKLFSSAADLIAA
jgi:translation initiation factor 4G